MAAAEETGGGWLVWPAGGGGLVLLVLLWLRYRREVSPDRVATADDIAEAVVEPVSSSPRGAVPGPWLTIALRPVRAGLNLVTAVADCEVTVTNGGSATAEAVRAGISLIAAHDGQSEEIDALNAGTITRPVVPAFALEPGKSRTFRTIAAAPIDRLQTMRVGEEGGGREMLVPLVVITFQHRDLEGLEHRTSQTFVLGVERVDSPKLAPFWLDSMRMVDQVAARPSGATLRRGWQVGQSKHA